MKNVTITLDEATLQRARVAAAKQGKSLSKFVSELVTKEVGYDPEEVLRGLQKHFEGPGFPGAAKLWEGREKLYAEREDELLRRYDSHRVLGGSEGSGETAPRRELAERDDQQQYTGPQPTKPK
jgi:hypothetical protein